MFCIDCFNFEFIKEWEGRRMFFYFTGIKTGIGIFLPSQVNREKQDSFRLAFKIALQTYVYLTFPAKELFNRIV